jgi:hypothetical protein
VERVEGAAMEAQVGTVGMVEGEGLAAQGGLVVLAVEVLEASVREDTEQDEYYKSLVSTYSNVQDYILTGFYITYAHAITTFPFLSTYCIGGLSVQMVVFASLWDHLQTLCNVSKGFLKLHNLKYQVL